MSDDIQNHTLRLLQEMRAEMRERHEASDARFAELEHKIDGNTVLLNLIAGSLHDHEHRLRAVEKETGLKD